MDRAAQSPEAQEIQAMADDMREERQRRRQQQATRRNPEQIPAQGHPMETEASTEPAEPVLKPYQHKAIHLKLQDLNMAPGHLCRTVGVGSLGAILDSDFERVMSWLLKVEESQQRRQA